MNMNVLARDSLKSKQGVKGKTTLFGVLYDFLLYAAIPVAFEMSFVKIFQNSMRAYEVNDVVAMGRLIIYFAVQWFLGVLVRRDYLKSGIKRLTLVVMIMVQVKEAFFQEVFIDMVISMVLESGFAVLFFLKFAQLMVILQCMGLLLVVFAITGMTLMNNLFNGLRTGLSRTIIHTGRYIHRIHPCIRMYSWCGSHCCYRGHQLRLA